MTSKKFKFKEFFLAKPKVWISLGIALIGFYIFLKIGLHLFYFNDDTYKILEIDQSIMLKQLEFRVPHLNGMMADISGLGSEFTLYFVSTFSVLMLLTLGDRVSAVQFALAAYGSSLLTSYIKNWAERPRPRVIPQLIEIGNFSFPSGHACSSSAIYMSVALVAAHYFPKKTQRALLFGAAIVLMTLISYSRVYLGVHYPSDIVAGASLGLGWVFLLMGFREYFWPHSSSKLRA